MRPEVADAAALACHRGRGRVRAAELGPPRSAAVPSTPSSSGCSSSALSRA